MKIKKGDKVYIRVGKDKGKTGAVIDIDAKAGTVVVEGLNMVKRHAPAKAKVAGQILAKPAPMNISKVALIDPKTKKPTRVGYKVIDGKKVRIAKKSGNEIK